MVWRTLCVKGTWGSQIFRESQPVKVGGKELYKETRKTLQNIRKAVQKHENILEPGTSHMAEVIKWNVRKGPDDKN